MNIQRAREIAESGDLAKVTLNGIPVYIQHVDDDGDTVRIYPLNDPQNEQNVSVQQLQEG
ncbi:H-type small acid-soluble spore protein [Sutcliffiella cohnii]|uniref:Small, acid-soluble spore protein H n=1 Tax=Sutcliffiella cohnii TaxID=33932 RepID=A0A223KPW4_9BACI|nr:MULTISPECIES: H-type small acid-soluble spore protein [Sutcliffiella]AST91522.1 small, acid-soluble spore protein, H family [Sutcliffiella cohnii]MED4014908.1 H-type small acid-soluble spore protein [Sutcliffiella cohnii]WBL17354.1 H-type small acid-soluble spore protein [Sutcliffiella sp. NC1]